MEMFKVCEKETKTKTYSKEGLARAEKLDPEALKRKAANDWLQEFVNQFNTAIEDHDAEIEKLSSGKGKKTNRHAIEALNTHINNHRFHVNKLEGIMRLVMNETLEVSKVNEIKDDVEYYLER